MKNLFKLFIVLVCCTAAMSLTSCLSESEDYSIDLATQKSYMSSMQGSYNCAIRLYKLKDNNNPSSGIVQYDSIFNQSVTFRTDSTFKVTSNQVVNSLDSAIIVSDNDKRYEALAEALKNYTGQPEIAGTYYIPYTKYVSTSTLFYWGSIGFTVKLNYDNADHYVHFLFAPTTDYLGYWTNSRQLYMLAGLAGIYVTDGKATVLNSSNMIDKSYVRTIYVAIGTK